MDLQLIRIIVGVEEGSPTYGILIGRGKPVGLTLELPWRNNQKEISCIPDGSYVCKRREDCPGSYTAGLCKVYEVLDVPNRTGILIHVGNFLKQIQGCILIGEKFGSLTGGPAILQSKDAYIKFMKDMELYETFKLNIVSIGNICRVVERERLNNNGAGDGGIQTQR